MKTSNVILIAVLFLIIGIIISAWYIKSNNVCYDLPEHGSTSEWGPKYWAALSNIAHRVPCSLCRGEAEEMISFLHDRVNLKLDKKLYDEQNFDKWLNIFYDIKSKRDQTNAR